MNDCTECGAATTRVVAERPYLEAGLPHVRLSNVEVSRCGKCGREFLRLPHMEQLHLLIAAIFVFSLRRLLPSEIRFLRKHTGRSSADFAECVRVTDETVLAWESGIVQMPIWAELRLRAMVLREKPVTSYDALKPVGRRLEPHVSYKAEHKRWEKNRGSGSAAAFAL